jgi:hypothetical protein
MYEPPMMTPFPVFVISLHRNYARIVSDLFVSFSGYPPPANGQQNKPVS